MKNPGGFHTGPEAPSKTDGAPFSPIGLWGVAYFSVKLQTAHHAHG